MSSARLSIRAKLSLLIVLVAALLAVILYGLVIPLVEQEKRTEREGTLRAVVESATSLIQYYEDVIRTYRWKTDPALPRTRDEAKKLVLDHLRQIRYREDEHIFVLDGSARMVMHPLKPELDGEDMARVRAPDGSFPFAQMAIQSQRQGSVFVRYSWLSKWSQSVHEPQTTYARYFYPWDWAVCSSLYTQDIDEAVRGLTLRMTLYVGAGLLAGWSLLFLIGLRITNPVVLLARQVRDAAGQGDESAASIIRVQGNDEIGDLADAFRHTLDSRQQAMIRLRESEENLRTTLNSIGDAVIAMDIAGRVTRMNPVAETLTGWTLEGARNKPLTEVFNIVNAKTREAAVNPVEQVLRSGEIVGLANHTLLLSKGRSEYQVADSAAPIRNSAGQVTGVVLVFRDVTEEYRMQEQLRHLRNYLASIIDSMPSILVGVDSAGRITQWNREAERNTGVSVVDAVGQPLVQVFSRLENEMERVLEAIRTQHEQFEHRRIHLQDDEVRYEDVTIYPLVADGVEGAVIRVDDVTERVRIEEMMVQNEKMLSVGGLAAGMAHEINNPLAGIMQTADVLSRRLTADMPANERAAADAGTTMASIRTFLEVREVPKMLRRIRESGDRAAAIVSNMLDFARKGGAARSSNDLVELLDRSVDLAGSDFDLKKKYDFREIEIIREYAADLPLVPCDGGTIQQVMLNILSNGAEAMQENDNEKTPCFILRVGVEGSGGMASIEIEDNGPGMDDETCKRIFEPFFTTKPVGMGTGLGLSVSYFIVTENHGGEMSVESRPGQGTKFIVRLPLEGRPLSGVEGNRQEF